MQFSSQFIINSILALAVISVSIAGFVMNDLFTITFNIEFREPQTNILFDFRVAFQFRREDFILKVFVDSKEMARLIGVGRGSKIAEKTFPYNKINDVEFLSNIIVELIQPITNAVIKEGERRGIIIRPEDRQRVETFVKNQVKSFLTDNKKGLDEAANIANIFKTVIIAMMPFFILNALYMIFGYRFFFVSLILFILVLAMTLIFTAFVILLPPKISEATEGVITLEPGFTMRSYLANSYVAVLMFFVIWFASSETRIKKLREYTNRIKSRLSLKRK